MVDLHTHILPGIDDGADCIEESLAMLRQAYYAGTRHMVVTPHFWNRSQSRFELSRAQLEQRFNALAGAYAEQGGKIKLYLGAEHYGTTEIGGLCSAGEVVPINGSKYVLIEFDFEDDFQRVSFVLSQLRSFGYIPIIAHPERYDFIGKNPSNVYVLLEKGCLFQINKGSPFGRYGSAAAKVSNWMLDNRIAHFVASDCHSPFQRTPELRGAHELLTYRLGAGYADRLFIQNPMRVLQGEPVSF